MAETINSFPGYKFVRYGSDGKPHNIYRDTDVGFGGYIISNPGIYTNVALLDIASLHPNSIRAMNCFGDYTKNFTDILDARLAIKHGDYDTARTMLNGRLAKYLDDESTAKQLAQALKIAVNSVYGLTAANFDNPFRDKRNDNNIVALRGALFMRTLQDEVESRGFNIVAIKTDSIKIANATKEIIDFCMGFAAKYSYTFEHEATYDRMCQINDADYIARYKDAEWCEANYGYVPGDNKKHPGEWTATGAQFQVPYVFKRLFSKETIEFDDMCETKAVTSALYLDMNESLPDVTPYENLKIARCKSSDQLTRKEQRMVDEHAHLSEEELDKLIEEGHVYTFIGKVGRFCPIKPGYGGGELLREKDGKYYAATGSKGYRWLEAETVKILGKENDIDPDYFRKLVDTAVDSISKYGDFYWFVSDDSYDTPPWLMACGKESCDGCDNLTHDGERASCRLGHDIGDFKTLNNLK